MKIVVIGATGTIGREVTAALSHNHEVITVGHSHGNIHVDLASVDSIRRMFDTTGKIDAVVSTAGIARFGMLDDLTDEDFAVGLNNKLMGQVNLIRLGHPHIRDNGSFTLTSGVLSREPMKGSSAISMVNAGIEAFARAAALELPRGIRINVVSPIWVSETLAAMGKDTTDGMPAEKVARVYVDSVEGQRNGTILDVRQFT